LSFDLLDELERDFSFQHEFAMVDVSYELRHVVYARQQPARLLGRLAAFDLRVEPRVERRVDGQRAVEPERRAVGEALLPARR